MTLRTGKGFMIKNKQIEEAVKRNLNRSERRNQRIKEAELMNKMQKLHKTEQKVKQSLEQKSESLKNKHEIKMLTIIKSNKTDNEVRDRLWKQSILQKEKKQQNNVAKVKTKKFRQNNIRKEIAQVRFETIRDRRRQIERKKAKQIENLKYKQEVEHQQYKDYMQLKENLKNQRLRGIMDAEAELNALNEVMHHVEVWNAWDQVAIDNFNKLEHKEKIGIPKE